MPFLRLTRDRRGAEHTFLMHAGHSGERPRVLYWYRTAPDIQIGRSPLDEEAIRTIEEQHPDIEFDWPAILALSEAMIHEDETVLARSPKPARQRPPQGRDRPIGGERPGGHGSAAEPAAHSSGAPIEGDEVPGPPSGDEDGGVAEDEAEPIHTHALLEELVGREIATRLHARHAEICARIHERHPEGEARDAWLRRAEAIDPNTWLTPEAVLDGVRSADRAFEQLRGELLV